VTDVGIDGLKSALRALTLIPPSFDPEFVPLTGGVASDIWLVRAPDRPFVVKRALEKLRVAADWRAPVSRNASEVGWFQEAAVGAPGAVPKILAHSPGHGFFVMEYLPPETHPVWKRALLDGRADVDFAAEVGARLGAIHAHTAGRAAISARVSDDALFRAIRLEPYFEFTALRRPRLAGPLAALVARTLANRKALVHGDVSPKNILAGPSGPVFLDAECAWYGDPAFDLAFCLNHLLLKCLVAPQARERLLLAFDALSSSYFRQVRWESGDEVERRASALLPALLLARVDGKSPVEYITSDAMRDGVRAFAIPLIEAPPGALSQIRALWGAAAQTL